ncbi:MULTISPECIES: SRPBCC family protein [Cellulophaga]|uniref:Polyketide cyclase/dehydrase n=2 Tax=Cellulophaga TaxID=104264 RepID=F0RG15_CELLC|nr:hypothetical protein Celly_0140 [Cellulophaga lytica DSM 7489]AIM59055.1 polyketide cyclase [Cellulophaga lytica]APU08857.1 polyketide cyclase [Cellulophaga lytica]EWH14130.1 hypothetical protein KLA_05652 [Cellulophaga geojensis KL-A]TVZ09456.1 polyketide cyclase/dehydrase/lipid transport protein [Cellulophaga sp. RHA_52]
MIAVYILASLVVLVVILAVVAPKSFNVYRSIDITKSKDEVFNYVLLVKNQEIWSPWAKKDPNMARKYTGTDGTVGFTSYWNGNKEVGEGEQEITNIINGERIDGELRFFKPFKSTSDCYFKFYDLENNTTRVTWGFSGKNTFPMSIMMLFMNMDKAVGKDFEEGLLALKLALEN